MGEVTREGYIALDLTAWRRELEAVFREALGEDLDLSPETLQGQLIGVLALRLAQMDELVAATFRGLSRDLASGVQLDDLASLTGVIRRVGRRAEAVVTFSGVFGAAIPSGTRVGSTRGQTQVDFETLTDAEIESDGQVNVRARATNTGRNFLGAGSIDTLRTELPRINSVVNQDAVQPGEPDETDEDFRLRLRTAIARQGADAGERMRAALVNVNGVTSAVILENATAGARTVQGLTIFPGNVAVIVEYDPLLEGSEGDIDQAVASAISATKPVGVAMSSDPDGRSVGSNIRWSVANSRDVYITVTLAPANRSADFVTQIGERLVAHVNGLSIGQRLVETALYQPIYAGGGVEVQSLSVRMDNEDATDTEALGIPRAWDRFVLKTENVTIQLATP